MSRKRLSEKVITNYTNYPKPTYKSDEYKSYIGYMALFFVTIKTGQTLPHEQNFILIMFILARFVLTDN